MNAILLVDDQDQIQIKPEALMIKEFKHLWERDKTKGKSKARQELAYVFWMGYYKSIYDVYEDPREKHQAVKSDIISYEDWEPDEYVRAAIEKYIQRQETFSMSFLDAAKTASNELKAFFKNVNLNATDKNGKPIYKPKDITDAIKQSAAVVESLSKWEERVKKELEIKESNIRGGGDVGPFEDADPWNKDGGITSAE